MFINHGINTSQFVGVDAYMIFMFIESYVMLVGITTATLPRILPDINS
jgi:hypothetical protein